MHLSFFKTIKRKLYPISYFVFLYPYRVIFSVVLLIISGLAEAVSFAALIPLIGLALNEGDVATNNGTLQESISNLFSLVGLSVSMANILILITALMTIKSFLTYYTTKEIGYICADVEADFRRNISQSLFNAEWKFFFKNKTGDLSSIISTQVEGAVNIFRASGLVASGFIQVVLFLAMSLMLSVPVTIFSAILGFAIMLVLSRYNKLAKESSLKLTRHQGVLLSVLIDGLKSFKIYKAMGIEGRLVNYLNKDIAQLSKMRKRIVYSSAVINNFQEPIQIIVIALGVYFLTIYWTTGIEQLIVLILLFHRSGQRLGLLQVYYQQIITAIPSFSLIIDIIQASKKFKEDINKGSKASMFNSIDFLDVKYSYGNLQVLNGVSFRIDCGEFISIVGGSGEGKTTLFDMLLGFNKPDYGKITFDGISIDDFSKKSLRSMIGYVPQEATLFHDTIRNNIIFGDTTVEDKVIKEVLKQSGSLSFVENLPGGLDFIVGENGCKLSGGQKQRIGIARALLNNPRILILDEPTSSLDKGSEMIILNTLKLLRGRMTILAISHQQGLINVADKVYKLESGQVSRIA